MLSPRREGSVAPIGEIAGDKTWLVSPNAIASDAVGNIFVANSLVTQSIAVFAPHSLGNVAPTRVIVGPAAKLTNEAIMALDVDESGRLYVALGGTQERILVFAAGAHDNVPPVQTLQRDGLEPGADTFGVAVAGTTFGRRSAISESSTRSSSDSR